jgi:uncharacterized protein YhaN
VNLKSNAKNCGNTTYTQQIKIINDPKAKLASSRKKQEAYESLLAKMKTLCKHTDELTKNVAKFEDISSTLEAPKNEKSIFETT